MRTLNVGIVAHVDAGKTSLTERLLYQTGVLATPGSVDGGDTQTDSMALERQRGITIRSAVASFVVNDVLVNLIDTPGHSDFIAEVERALAILDGAVLVVSAVEGVQAQTRVLMRALRRLRIPTLIFVNKVDRAGARPDAVLRDLTGRLSLSTFALCTVREPGSGAATVIPGPDDPGYAERLTEAVAEHDPETLAAWADATEPLPLAGLRAKLAELTGRTLVHPVLFGSAMTGAGVDLLIDAMTELLPATVGDPSLPVAATIFKIDRGPGGEKLTYLRVRAGAVNVRDRLDLGHGRTERITSIRVFGHDGLRPTGHAPAGRIALVRGLDTAQVGDEIGPPGAAPALGRQFSRPTLETVVDPVDPAEKGAAHAALAQLAEQDPLISLRQDDTRNELSVSLYGEVQKEVIGAVLATDYGVDVTFRESSTICIEQLTGAGQAAETIGVPPNPFMATVGLRVEPAPAGAGVTFALEVELGSMPLSFFTAVEAAARETLTQGLHGWDIPDCRIVMTRSGFWSIPSTAGDFRNLTPLVLAAALRAAGTRVCEPVHRFELEAPEATTGGVLTALAKLQATPLGAETRRGTTVITGDIPAAAVHRLQQLLPGLTHGEGVLTSALHHHRPAPGEPPRRARTDNNPLNRTDYLKRVARRT